jgi:membrane associated rhomboid family serine protease
MEISAATISARSRVEAMDWSLVLISQGIESVITRAEEGRGWTLQVSAADYDSALEAIRLYRTENRGWGLRREILQPGLIFDWVSILWAALVSVLYWLNDSRIDLRSPGILDATAVSHGEWWRLFTAVWLHADLAHLASNVTFGFVLLGLTMGRYGTGVGLFTAYLAGVGGNVASWAFASQPHYGLGASGMVMGCLGLLAVQSVSIWRGTPHGGKIFLTGISAGVLLFVLLGVTPGTDVVAHFGGFVCGLFLGLIMTRFARALRKSLPNLITALAFAVLVIWPWWLALERK